MEGREAGGVILAVTDERVAREDRARVERAQRANQAHGARRFVLAVEAQMQVHAGSQRARAARFGEFFHLRDAFAWHALLFADVEREIRTTQRDVVGGDELREFGLNFGY